jgi:hypothetical protein
MAVILGLLIFCLGIYFLGLFFQVARLEKQMAEDVSLLERFMIVTYALGEDKKEKKEDGEAAPGAPAKPA